MKIINNPATETWQTLCSRPVYETDDLSKKVAEIFLDIKITGDRAVQKYTNAFDKVNIDTSLVNEAEINGAENKLTRELINAIQIAKNNIEKFHAAQKEPVVVTETSASVFCWRESRAIEKIGLYIPGGTAPLFSTVLMLGIPAQIAGCREIVLCTPPQKDGSVNPAILYAAKVAGITKVFKAGGIQAIAALTYGTETIPKADKIFGPGNQYVTAAKKMAQALGTAIDLPAGPSELLIIADKTSDPAFVAADLLSQAEHGPDSQVILLSDDADILNAVLSEVNIQLKNIPRSEIAKVALENSHAILLKDPEACIAFSNEYAPEHLILAIKEAKKYLPAIINAGSVFIGKYSCESAGDYASGTNHTLPTNGYAKSYSGVSLDSFVKKITFQEITKEGFRNIGPAIEVMAAAEELYAHKNAVTVRLNKINNV